MKILYKFECKNIIFNIESKKRKANNLKYEQIKNKSQSYNPTSV